MEQEAIDVLVNVLRNSATLAELIARDCEHPAFSKETRSGKKQPVRDVITSPPQQKSKKV